MSSEIVVEISSGKLRGTTGKDYHNGDFYKFLGIPYAKAPIGELRFKAPQPIAPWTNDILDVTKEGPECPASHLYFQYFIGNEDNCLNLNVYTKDLPKHTPLDKPVMVWIHGGAFVTGSNKSEMFGPDYLMTQDIVLVAINYRLGILGFASFQDPTIGVPGNNGLKDMRLALQWVQKNIEKFGGNPDNVTIFGESAGAASIHYLTLAPTTQGLFHKAIIQSGSALNNWTWGTNNAKDIAQCLGYKDITDEKRIFEKLKKESSRNIVSGQKRVKENFRASDYRPWGPVVEPESADAIITEHPSRTVHEQGGHKIPIIIGYNSNEGIFFELIRRTIPGTRLPKDLQYEIPYEFKLVHGSDASQEVAKKLKKHYFNDDHCNEENIGQVYRLKGDTQFIYPIHRAIRMQAKHSTQPVFAYRMDLQTPLNYFHSFAMSKYFKTTILMSLFSKITSNFLPVAKSTFQNAIRNIPKREFDGVAHADDLFYLFPTFFTPQIKLGSIEDMHIQRFVKLWTNFARHGEPTPPQQQQDDGDDILNGIKWLPITSHHAVEFLEIGEELRMIENVDRERLQIWDELYEMHVKI